MGLNELVQKLVDVINIGIPVLISLGILLLFYHAGWGIFGAAKDSGEARSQLNKTLLWGVLVIFLMVSIWGVLQLIGGEFNLIRAGF